jgi:uncharacterized protein YndB with AHSA1/START domain
MFGVTLSGGVAIPTDDDLEKGWYMAVSGEGYFTPRFSIRAQFGGAFHDVEFGGADGKVSPVHITGDAVYNWEHGKWHPYVSGGIGFYTYRFGEGDDRPTDFEMGFNFGGGVEFFFTRRLTGPLRAVTSTTSRKVKGQRSKVKGTEPVSALKVLTGVLSSFAAFARR